MLPLLAHGLPEEHKLRLCYVEEFTSSLESYQQFTTFTILAPQCSLLACRVCDQTKSVDHL
eukprot:12888442-Prorocentrum_lima.AAC.1